MAHAEPPSPDQGTVSALCPFDHEEEQGEADERQRPQLEGGKSCRGQKSKQKGGDVGMTCQHRSEEHTSELQSLMRISYAVFCLKKKKKNKYVKTNNAKRQSDHQQPKER